MSVKIQGVVPGSRAEQLHIHPGDILVSINGVEVTDVLDYRFLETERELHLTLLREEKEYQVSLKKPQYAEIGLEFDSYLMDEQHSCRNKCIFCFIDQLPKGLRKTLYFKDDDDRLSFLFGNYITLTNIDDREIDRVLRMHISPINVSVHTMNPELRCTMMHNRFAGDSLRHLKRLADGGIKLNCQIVLCPGVNDGKELEFSLQKLYELGENLLSVACVPVGLTRYREGLYPLEPFNRDTASAAIDLIEQYGERFLKERGSRTVFPSDELYLLAERPLPPLDFYEDLPQIENGVGMLRDFEDEFTWAMEDLGVPENLEQPRHVTIPTGEGPYAFLQELLDELRQRCHNLTIDLVPIKNNFFGGGVNVTGLLTGGDLTAQLQGRDIGDEILIVSSMLKADEDIFLDDVTLTELSERLSTPARRIKGSGEGMLCAILGRELPAGAEHNPYEQGSWEHLG